MTTSNTEHGSSGWVLFGAFICGALTGATIALLLDEERGRDIRERIVVKAREGREQASKVLDHAAQTIRQEAAEAVADARAAFRKARTEATRES